MTKETVSLVKGETLSFVKEAPGLTKVLLGAGWDVANGGAAIDVDLLTIGLQADGKTRSDRDVCFFNNKTTTDGSTQHSGDNRTGEGEGDDETIAIDLTKVDASIVEIVVAITIYNASSKGQDFSKLQNAYVRAVNAEDNVEITRFNVTSDLTGVTYILGKLTRVEGGFAFTAIGEAKSIEVGDLIAQYRA